MSTIRFFDPSRTAKGRADVRALQKLEAQVGELTSAEKYKFLMNQKLAAYQADAMNRKRGGAQLSVKARQALEEIAKRKANKEEKALRKRVIIKPRRYYDVGYIDAKGAVYDQVGNLVFKVNKKNGNVNTMGGMTIFKYQPKSWNHASLMRDNLIKYSPYHIKLRQMMAQQQMQAMYNMYGAAGQDGMDAFSSVYGVPDNATAVNIYGYANNAQAASLYGGQTPPAQDAASALYGGGTPANRGGVGINTSVGVSAWGAMSGNVHGTFAENTWGSAHDNVWGGVNSNIWGGLADTGGFWGGGGSSGGGTGGFWGGGGGLWSGGGGLFGRGGKHVWGSQKGPNYVAKALWSAASALKLGSRLAARQNAQFKARQQSVARQAPQRAKAPVRTSAPSGGSSGGRSG